MIWMTKMENMVMNLTGCSRQIANTVVNWVIDEWENEEDDNDNAETQN